MYRLMCEYIHRGLKMAKNSFAAWALVCKNRLLLELRSEHIIRKSLQRAIECTN